MGLPDVAQQQLEVGVGKCGRVAGAPGARVAQEDLTGGAAQAGLQGGEEEGTAGGRCLTAGLQIMTGSLAAQYR